MCHVWYINEEVFLTCSPVVRSTVCVHLPVCTSAPVPGKLPKNFRDLMSCFCIVMTGTNTTQW